MLKESSWIRYKHMKDLNMTDYALRIRGLKKEYRLGEISGKTLQEELKRWWAIKRGQEDPLSKIGAKKRITGDRIHALDGIDLDVREGEALGIIGKNGAGKSTLLKLLCQITAPTEGEILLKGRIASMLEVGIGFNGEMTGRENIYLNGAILGMTKAEIDAKLQHIIDFSEIEEFIDTPVKRYSSGMYVKLAFSVAAHLNSEIMIMDEVLAVGDINFQQKCLKKMRNVALEDGRTVLYVSHNMSTIRTLCTRCIVLDSGKVIFDGAVNDAINVYSTRNVIERKNDYDLRNLRRVGELNGDQFLNHVHLEKTELEVGDYLDFDLEIQSKIEIDNGILRFVLNNKIGEPIATTYSQFYSLKKGINKVRFRLKTDELTCGEYSADLVLCVYDGVAQTRHDALSRTFAFYVLDNNLYNAKWNTPYWGSIKLNEILVS